MATLHTGTAAVEAGAGPVAPPPDQPGPSGALDTARLLPQHLVDLARSGLSADQFAACGFYSESDAAAVARLLGWKGGAGRLGPCLVIPFPNADGAPTDFARVKPDRPRLVRGKPAKYEGPAGRPNRAYVPPGTRAVLADPAVPLLVTEGEKKCAKADQDGFPCLGLTGVWSWQRKREVGPDGKRAGPRELIPDLAAVAWKGRRVYLAYDSDLADNPAVRLAEWHLAKALMAAGATVRAVRLPAGSGGFKRGLDDYLVSCGADDFRALLAAAVRVARPPRRPPGGPPAPGELTPPAGGDATDDPHRLAGLFLEGCRDAGRRTLRFWRGEFHEWEAGAYRPVTDGDVRGRLTACARAEFVRENAAARAAWEQAGGDDKGGKAKKGPPPTRKVTTPLVANVRNALESLCRVPADMVQPTWLDGAAGPDPRTLLAVGNGLLDLSGLAAGLRDCLAPPNPSYFAASASPVAFDPHAAAPARWFTFLREVLPGDPASVRLLQEWFGLMLTPDTSFHKMLFLLGSGRNGKGTVARVLAELVGEANVVAPTLSGLTERFGLMPLLGKPVAVVGDCRLSARSDSGVIVERLNNITGEDPLTVDRKGRDMVTVRLPTRFTILSNELPRLPDAAGAVAGRMLILPFPVSFRGKEDRFLAGKLRAELSGILLWAAAGIARLRARGRFAEPVTAAPLARQMADLSSPVGAFVRDRCRVGVAERVAVNALYCAWESWCTENHRRDPGTVQTFGQALQAAVPGLRECRPKRDGERWREYLGVGLAGDAYAEADADATEDVADPVETGADPFAWPPFGGPSPAPAPPGSAGSAALTNPEASGAGQKDGARRGQSCGGRVSPSRGPADPADPAAGRRRWESDDRPRGGIA